MANIKRDIQMKLLDHHIIKGKFVGKSPRNGYFKKNKQHQYELMKEKTVVEIYRSMNWEIPRDLLNREGIDKGGRPKSSVSSKVR